MEIKLTDEKEKIRKSNGEIVTVYQTEATEDITIATLDRRGHKGNIIGKTIKKGTRGGFVEPGVIIGDGSWIDKGTVVLGHTQFYGVTRNPAPCKTGVKFCMFIEDSLIHRGSILLGRAVIRKTHIGHDVVLDGTNRLENTHVWDNVCIVGTVIRDSEIGKNSVLKCAGTLEKAIVEDGTVM